ncbi:putative lipoprotein (plasmid) [Sinorhizobium sojae CCBAU 05684]|uniref:Putative lipoprotein n=1 Tax=Sinorhizobium sojae CCBAU 05684 TaxID=716928 RepID=A0A249PM41_9HYPH|nr:hypothetical protein [Sinorhizobium sojae]ASY66802.1 putative lipoprotein [Sinorhizobium sojae CCBAU 05684]
MRTAVFVSAIACVVALSPNSALSQQAATVKVAESEQHGQYLTDGEGRALYLFTADTQGQADQKPTVSCSGECLQAWPPLYSEGAPQAGDGADAAKLGTAEHAGKMMVTYNGWPLYYFAQDAAAGETKGQDVESFGGEWYLVTPAGEKAGES